MPPWDSTELTRGSKSFSKPSMAPFSCSLVATPSTHELVMVFVGRAKQDSFLNPKETASDPATSSRPGPETGEEFWQEGALNHQHGLLKTVRTLSEAPRLSQGTLWQLPFVAGGLTRALCFSHGLSGENPTGTATHKNLEPTKAP